MAPTIRHHQALDDLQVTLAMEGDRKAFELLYRRWRPRLLRHAMGLIGNREDAHDIMQDAALAIARNIHRLQTAESFGPWAYTIIRNRAADYIKRAQRDRAIKDVARTDVTMANTAVEPPAHLNARTDDLHHLITTLSTTDREILAAFYIDGMSIHEIARCVGIPEGTVKSRLHNARTRLKTAYQTEKGNDHE